MYEIVRRSLEDGEVLYTISSFITEEDAEEALEEMYRDGRAAEDSWYEVRRQLC